MILADMGADVLRLELTDPPERALSKPPTAGESGSPRRHKGPAMHIASAGALVVGGASGLGGATARSLAAAGASADRPARVCGLRAALPVLKGCGCADEGVREDHRGQPARDDPRPAARRDADGLAEPPAKRRSRSLRQHGID